MSLHHGLVFHGFHKNKSDDRRIGLAIRYITPSMKQTIREKTDAVLVSGVDNFDNFNLTDKPQGLMPFNRRSVFRGLHIELRGVQS